MSKSHASRCSEQSISMPHQSANSDNRGANAQLIDEAPRVPLKPGLEARYGLCPASQLMANPNAVRVHSKRQLDKLSRSIEVSGALSPVIIDDLYMILAGHGRVEVIQRTGTANVPVVQVFGLSEAQKRQFLLSDNRIGEDGRLDREKLAGQIPGLTTILKEAGLELTDTGFEVAEIDEIIVDFEDDGADPDDAFDATLLEESPFLEKGDLIQLGNHYLAVADARDAVMIDRLMRGQKAQAVFVDVPYNVKIAGIVGRGRIQHAEFAFASGEMTRPQYVEFLLTSLGNAARVSEPGAVHFVCIDWKHVADLIEASEKVYGAYLNLVVWNKTNAGQGGLYRSQHELIGVFRVGHQPHADNVQNGRFGRNRSNVWTYPGVNTFRAGRMDDLSLHPTVKPIQLVADALKDVTRPGAIVLDTFVGSGSTILAGEKFGRHVRAIEIEPRYAQLACRRWERLTGHAAVHCDTGLSLDALKKKRLEDPAEGPPHALQGRTSLEASPAAPWMRVRTKPAGG